MMFFSAAAAVEWFIEQQEVSAAARRVNLERARVAMPRQSRRPGLSGETMARLEILKALDLLTAEQRAALRLGALEPGNREAWPERTQKLWHGAISRLGRLLRIRELLI